MVHFSYSVNGETVFVSLAEDGEDKKQLETLVREVNFIASTYVKTGLYIVHTLIHKENFVILTSLRKKVIIEDNDLAHVVNKIDELTSRKEIVMKGLSILRVDPSTIFKVNSRTLESSAQQWAELYCEIWKEPPWNEDFWEPRKVLRELYKEIQYQHGEAFLALDQERVVGFTHGYSVTCQEMRAIAGGGLLNKFFKRQERVYYVDELGVAKEYRGKQISLWLSRSLIHAARDHSLQSMLLRTDTQATAARHLYAKLGFTELSVQDAKYPNRTYWHLEL